MKTLCEDLAKLDAEAIYLLTAHGGSAQAFY
jgi:hypothetical protein